MEVTRKTAAHSEVRLVGGSDARHVILSSGTCTQKPERRGSDSISGNKFNTVDISAVQHDSAVLEHCVAANFSNRNATKFYFGFYVFAVS